MFGLGFRSLLRIGLVLGIASLVQHGVLLRAAAVPQVSLSTNNLVFGPQPIGTSAAQNVTVTNSGTATLTINALAAFGPFEVPSNSCWNFSPTSLLPGGTCTFQVVFAPNALGGFGGVVNLYSNAPNTPQTISVAGTGTRAINLLGSPSSIAFAFPQKILIQDIVETMQITNATAGAVSNVSVSVTGANPSDFLEASNCPSTLAVDSSCTVSVAFYPQMIGSRSALLSVMSSVGEVDFPLTGTGQASGTFEIVNGLSGKALDLDGGSSAAGTLVQQNSLSGTPQQRWTLVPTDSGYYEIVNAVSGRVLDVIGEATVNGAGIQQYDYLGGTNQQWQLVPVDDVHYEIVNRLSGKVLDVPGGSVTSGTSIQQWEYQGSPQQLWVLVPTVSYQITNTLSTEVLDVAAGAASDGVPVRQSSLTGGNEQQWQFVPVGGGYYAIVNLLTGKVLDVTGESTVNGSTIQQWDYLGGANQQWGLQPVNTVALPTLTALSPQTAFNFKIVNRLSGKVLDNTGFSTASGTGIQQWDFLGGTNQQWQLTPSNAFLIENVRVGRVLDVPGGSSANGTEIQIWTANGFLQQEWRVVPVSGGYYAIFNSLTRKALQVSGSSDADGALIDQSDFTAAANQLWQFVIPPHLPVIYSPIYLIINKKSGKVLDDPDSAFADGTLMQQWDDLEGGNQQWYLIPTGN